jgi:DNA-binding transcriptional ArsR family regulator
MSEFSKTEIHQTVQGLRAIAHELRLAILCLLAEGPLNVGEIIARTGAAQSNVSQHLAKMYLLGLVARERHGKQTYYYIADPKFITIIEALKSVYCTDAEKS